MRTGAQRRAGGAVLALCLGGMLVPPAFAAAPVTNAPLDLETAIRMALARNRQLALGGLSVQRREQEVESSRQSFSVNAGPYGGVDRTDDGTAWRYGLNAARTTTWGTELGLAAGMNRYPDYVDEAWRTAVSVDIRQPLFRRFGPAYNREPVTEAEERLAAERRKLEQQRAGLIVELVETFERVVRLEKQVEADRRVLERLERTRELTRLRERQGRVSGVDALRAEQQYGDGVSRLDADGESLYQARRDLADLLGVAPESEYRLVSPPLPDIAVPDAAAAVSTALSNRLDYAQAIRDCGTARRKAALARRGLQPDVVASARYQQYGDDETQESSMTLDESLWTVGVAGNIDVVQARERAALRVANVDTAAAQETIRIKEQTIARDVQQALSAYRRARGSLTNAGRTHDVAAARVELAHRLFEAGRGDSFSVADAEQAFVAAEISLLTARADVSVAGYRLLQEMGTLVDYPAALKPHPAEGQPP